MASDTEIKVCITGISCNLCDSIKPGNLGKCIKDGIDKAMKETD